MMKRKKKDVKKMYQSKIPKSQKPDNASLYLYTCHDKDVIDYNVFWGKQDYRQIITIDIGFTNLCLRISRRYIKPKKINVIAFEKTQVKIDNDEDGHRVLFNDLNQWFDRYRERYFETHVIIIEWQLPQNYKAVRISTFILTYFFLLLKNAPLLPLILEMRSTFKDDYFPVLKPLNQHARKNKCVEIALDLLKNQEDYTSIEVMSQKKNGKKKQDDYADTALMEEVFCRYVSSMGWNFPCYSTDEIKKKKPKIVINTKS